MEKYSNSTTAGLQSFLFIIFIEKGVKRIRINLLIKEIHATTV